VDLGLAGTERPTKGNPGVGHSRRPSALRRRLLFRVIVAATAAVLCTLGLSAVAGQAAWAAAAPTVTSVSPGEGVATGGIQVTITGSGFTGATAVVFGSTDEAFTVVSDTEIKAVESAQPVGTVVDVTVVTPNGTSAVTPADQFTFVPGTEITGISPAAGSIDGGNTVTITGTGFTGTTFVVFQQFVNGTSHTRAASFTVDSDTQITATVPPAPGGVSGNAIIDMLTPIGNDPSSPLTFYDYVGPTVTGVNPALGLVTGGTKVSVKGTGFTSGTTVQFGSTPATSVTVLSSTSLSVVAPPGSPGLVDVTVTTADGTSPVVNGDRFTYVALPTVTGVSPAAGPTAGGNTVTITGTGFQNIFGFPGVSTVDFGSVQASSFTVDSDTQLTATVPAGAAGTVDVTLLTWLGATTATSAADQYAYLPVPAVTGVSPGSGLSVGGNTVTVTGTGFTDATAVDFGQNAAANVTVNSDTSITATVPAGAVGIDDVTVTTPGGTSAVSAADQYVYHPTCTTTITGAHSGDITVSSGLTCLVDATQAGQVTVEAGAGLSVTGSTVSGSVTAAGPAGITYCGSTEAGNLTVTGAAGPVVLSGALPDGTACAADTISGAVAVTGASAPVTVTGLRQRGTLTLENDTAGVDLDGGQLNGSAYVSGNTATAPAAITVSGVAVTGSLYCTGNSPAPTDAGTLNTVSAATAADQCTGLEEQG
jgi:hypothetical protein